MTQNVYEFLRGNNWFSLYNDEELQLLAQFLKVRTYDHGDTVYAEGSAGASCHIVMAGEVDIFKNTPDGSREGLTAFGPGGVVGLVAMIDGKRHSETCMAHGSTMCLELLRSEFDRLFTARSALAYKFILKVVRVLVRQLRVTNERLSKITAQTRPGQVQQSEVLKLLAEAESAVSEDIELDEVDYVVFEGQGPPRY